MSYYKNVYLKGINRFGNNLQQRIVNDREYEFHNFVKKSPNRVTVFTKDKKFEGVLQTKEVDEVDTINYFLTYKSINDLSGKVLKILDVNDPEIYTNWLVICKEHFTSTGYNKYTVIKLEREIRWITDEGYLYKTLVHVSGAGSNARDVRILNKYTKTDNSIVYMPPQTLTITMPDSKMIQRGNRTNIKGMVWKISGIDNITNDGVAYVTLEQDYTDKENDNILLPDDTEDIDGIASGNKMDYWRFTSNLIEHKIQQNDNNFTIINLSPNTSESCEFSAIYFDEISDAPLKIEVLDNNSQYEDFKIITTDKSSKIKVSLLDSPDIFQIFIINVEENDQQDFKILGPTIVKMGQPFIVSSTLKENFDIISINPDINKLLISKDIEKGKKELTFNNIINDCIITYRSKEEETYDVNYKCVSPWLGGI